MKAGNMAVGRSYREVGSLLVIVARAFGRQFVMVSCPEEEDESLWWGIPVDTEVEEA